MPYNGRKAREGRERLAQAILKAKTQPLQYDTPLIEGRQTSGFGPRIHPITRQPSFHTGVDLAAPEGDPVFATEDGYVSQAQHKTGNAIRGNNVTVRHADGRETRYEHMNRFAPAALKGGPVKKGDVLGYVGSTGRSTGPHLHYGRYRGRKAENPFG